MRRRETSFRLRSSVPRLAALEGTEESSSINMTPMIDVMMALLIIFMVVTPVVTNFSAQLPEALNLRPEPGDDVLTLGVDEAGRIFVGDERVEMAELRQHLERVYATRTGDHLLYLRADRNAEFTVVLDVLRAAQAAGVRTVGALANPLPPERPEEGVLPGAVGTEAARLSLEAAP